MLALREAHARGATRVSIAGQHVLTGGADGVVSLFAAKSWPTAPALWSFKCHEGPVTDVVLADTLELALSCGRDGRILLHESIFDTAKLVSRVICQVTGEVRCLQLDGERRRVFVAGDSLRCLDISQGRFQIHTIPLVVPFPIVALAVSPCGRYIAMGSASGEVGVVTAPATATATDLVAPPQRVQFVFRSVLSPTAKRDDAARYRMTWCHAAPSSVSGGLLLMVPTATEVQVFQLEEGNSSGGAGSSAPRMRAVGGLHDRQLTDLHGALVYSVSKNRLACLMASRDGIYVGKVEAKNLSMVRHTSEQYSTVPPLSESTGAVAITDVQVNAATGDVVVGLADGRVSLLRRAALKEWRPTTPTDVAEDVEEKTEGAVPATSARASSAAARNTTPPPPPLPAAAKKHTSKTKSKRVLMDEEDDADFIDDSDGDTASESSIASSSSSSSSRSSSDSGVAPEDFGRVVADLQKNGASVRANDEERPSRWRADDASAALAHAEREAARARSRFLDDEAEEGSTDDDDDNGSNDGSAHPQQSVAPQRNRRARYDNDNTDEEYGEEGGDRHHRDDASMEEQTEGDDEYDDEENARSGRAAGRGTASSSSAAAARLLSSGGGGGFAAGGVQDYSFQVGATPAGPEGSCYLAYNSVGYIHCSREATTVHFHDIAYPAVRLQLRDAVVMGTLSPVGAGLVVVPAEVSEAQGSVDEAPRLTILYHAFTPLGAQSEWRVALLPGETVRCMAAGIRYLAVATSHYLRIFSLSGLELAVLSKCQRIVTMVGTSSRKLMSSFKADFDPLAIVTLSGTGEVVMEVVDVGARAAALPARTIPLTELPDGSTHQLQWLGWSEDGLLHTADTAGVVRMFTEDWGGSWVPVYDPRTLSDQSFALWVYGVSDNALLAYRYARDDASYPAAAASGLSTELVPLFLPLTRTLGEEGRERWDRVLRQQIRSDELKRHSAFYSASIAKYDEVHDHHLLQLFDSALKAQQTTRALELAMLMEVHDRVVKCAQMANNSGYAKLVPKLLALYEMRMATKSKRRCALPLKEALVSERKKDELLRKLLGQVQPPEKMTSAGAPPADTAAVTESGGGSARTAVHIDGNDEKTGKSGPESRSPPRHATAATATAIATMSPSAASTATTTDTDIAAQRPPATTTTTTRRHISFAREAAPTPPPPPPASPPLSSASSPHTSTASSVLLAPHKVSNPFAKPSAASAAGTSSAPTQQQQQQQRQHSSGASTSTLSAPRQMSLLGASPQGSTPQRTMMKTTTTTATATASASASSPPARASPVVAHVADSGDAASGRASLSNTPEERRVSAGHTAASTTPPMRLPDAKENMPAALRHAVSAQNSSSSSSTDSAVKRATMGFVAQELPTHSSGPVDPFLASQAEESAYRASAGVVGAAAALATAFDFLTGTSSVYLDSGACSGGAPSAVSVQSLLDVGHGETAPVVRSDSFGEALRKRYREDDDEEDEDGEGGAPLGAVPKLSV